MRKCWECNGKLEVIGTTRAGIEVECKSCGTFAELEPDGLGEAGLEWVEAKVREIENNRE